MIAGDDLLDAVGVERARLGEERQRSGTTLVEPAPPWIEPTFAVVCVVDPAERHRGDRACAAARIAAAARPPGGCRRGRRGRGTRPRSGSSVGEATTISPIGVAWSKT